MLSYILAQPSRRLRLRSARDRRWRNEAKALRGLNPGPLRPFKKSPLLDILLVSKDFYYAGIKAYYGLNTLQFHTATHLKQFAETVGIDRRRCIRSIVVHIQWQFPSNRSRYDRGLVPADDESALDSDLLALFPSLRSAVVYCCLQHPASKDQVFMVDKDMVDRLKSAWPSKMDLVKFDS